MKKQLKKYFVVYFLEQKFSERCQQFETIMFEINRFETEEEAESFILSQRSYQDYTVLPVFHTVIE